MSDLNSKGVGLSHYKIARINATGYKIKKICVHSFDIFHIFDIASHTGCELSVHCKLIIFLDFVTSICFCKRFLFNWKNEWIAY